MKTYNKKVWMFSTLRAATATVTVISDPCRVHNNVIQLVFCVPFPVARLYEHGGTKGSAHKSILTLCGPPQ